MLPGKQYTPEDLGRLALRRAWLLVLPIMLGIVVAANVSRRLPNWYRSETLIMLMPQRVPESYVKTTSTDRVEDRLITLEEQILSRSRLERIILDLDLYQGLRARLPLESVVDRMRKEITIRVEGKELFRLSYISEDPETVQKVATRLSSLFIDENLRDRENQAEATNEFLDSQLQDARLRLIDHEKKLEEYRRQYSGQLPTQAASNLQAIQNLQLQVQGLEEASGRALERRLLLERQLADLQLAEPTPIVGAVTAAPGQVGGEGGTTAAALEAARSQLRVLLMRAKPDHPDVEMLQRTIRDLETKRQVELVESATVPDEKALEKVESPVERLREKRRRDLSAELDVLDHEIEEKQQQEARLRDQVAQYQSKLDAMPSRESDLVELTRDYRTLQATYESLLVKREDAKLAANLERRNIGQQFKVLDPAKVPERPFSPNRPLIVGGGAVGGLAVGLLLVGLLEYRDSSFAREDEVVRLCQVPVLALIPIMVSAEDRLRSRRRRVATIAATLLGLGAAAAVALSLLQPRLWL